MTREQAKELIREEVWFWEAPLKHPSGGFENPFHLQYIESLYATEAEAWITCAEWHESQAKEARKRAWHLRTAEEVTALERKAAIQLLRKPQGGGWVRRRKTSGLD